MERTVVTGRLQKYSTEPRLSALMLPANSPGGSLPSGLRTDRGSARKESSGDTFAVVRGSVQISNWQNWQRFQNLTNDLEVRTSKSLVLTPNSLGHSHLVVRTRKLGPAG